MVTAVEREGVGVSGRRLRIGWAIRGLTVLALVGVAVTAVLVLSQAPATPSIDEHPVVPIYTQDELAVLDLVARGVLPYEELSHEPFRTKQLVAQGVLPRKTLEQMATPYSAEQQRALRAAVAAGVIPKEVLEEEPFNGTAAQPGAEPSGP